MRHLTLKEENWVKRMTNKEMVLRVAITHYGYQGFFSFQIEQVLVPEYMKKSSISPTLSELKKQGYLTSYCAGITENGHRQNVWKLTEHAMDFPWT